MIQHVDLEKLAPPERIIGGDPEETDLLKEMLQKEMLQRDSYLFKRT